MSFREVQSEDSVDRKLDAEHLELKEISDVATRGGTEGHEGEMTVSKYAGLGLLETLKMFKLAVVFGFMAAFNACNDGYCYSIPGQSQPVPKPFFRGRFDSHRRHRQCHRDGRFHRQVRHEYKGTKTLDGHTVSIWGAEYTVGYIVILFFGSPLNDILGRKWCMLLLQLLMIISTVMSVTANNTGTWGGAKIFQGLSVGLVQATVQSYVSEIAPTRARGFLLSVYQFFFAFGQLTAAVATYIVNDMEPSKWRHALYSEFVLAGIALLFWGFLPESPRWCAQHGQTARARKLLASINRHVQDYDLEGEYAIIEQEIAEGNALVNASSKTSWLSLFKGVNRRRLLISFGPFAWQQWSGVPVIFGYSAYFFQLAGLANPFNGTLAVFLILLAGVVLSMFAIEKFGRRPGLLCGGVGLTACLLIVGGVASVKTQTKVTGGVIIAFSCVWVLIYALTLAPIGYTMLAETSTVVLRARTTSIAAGMTGCLNLVVNYCTPLMLSTTGANWGVEGTSFFYAGTCAIGLVLVYFFIPETKGRTFTELDELFELKIPARKFGSTKTSAQLAEEAP